MICPECRSETLAPGTTELALLRDGAPVVVRNVPGFKCRQCGYFEVAGDTAKRLDALLDEGASTGSVTAAVLDLERLPASEGRRKAARTH